MVISAETRSILIWTTVAIFIIGIIISITAAFTGHKTTAIWTSVIVLIIIVVIILIAVLVPTTSSYSPPSPPSGSLVEYFNPSFTQERVQKGGQCGFGSIWCCNGTLQRNS